MPNRDGPGIVAVFYRPLLKGIAVGQADAYSRFKRCEYLIFGSKRAIHQRTVIIQKVLKAKRDPRIALCPQINIRIEVQAVKSYRVDIRNPTRTDDAQLVALHIVSKRNSSAIIRKIIGDAGIYSIRRLT